MGENLTSYLYGENEFEMHFTVLCMMATESSIHKNVFVKEQIYHFSFRKGKDQFHQGVLRGDISL